MDDSRLFPTPSRSGWHGAAFALGAVGAATALSLPFRALLDSENAMVLYLVAIVVTAARHGGLAAVAASLLAVLAYNFFFTQPYYSFNVYDYHDVITLLLLMISSLVIGAQTSRLAEQTLFYRKKEQETAMLYAMANHLAAAKSTDDCLDVVREHLAEAFDAIAVVWKMKDAEMIAESSLSVCESPREREAAHWAYERREATGIGTLTLAGASFHYMPLQGSDAVLAAMPQPADRHFKPKELKMMAAFASLAQAALERSAQQTLAEERQIEAETESMRATLLSAISHDFRTPLASIRSAIDGLRLNAAELDAGTRSELLDSAHAEIVRLEHIVTNLLDLTRLTSGRLALRRDFYFLPELLGSALKATAPLLGDRPVSIDLPDDLPALRVDGLLIEQTLINLLENAARHTPAATPIAIVAERSGDSAILLSVCDQGPGVPPGEREWIFQSFHGSRSGEGQQGSGLGLAICRAVMSAHGGAIDCLPQAAGACFRLRLPVEASPILREEPA